jgi:hypothetical protein
MQGKHKAELLEVLMTARLHIYLVREISEMHICYEQRRL